MAKEIIPLRLIIELNEDGTFKDGILQYQLREIGVVSKRNFYTVGVKEGIKIPDLEKIVLDSVIHAEKAEQITKGVEDVKI
jgi:hypothetical protein